MYIRMKSCWKFVYENIKSGYLCVSSTQVFLFVCVKLSIFSLPLLWFKDNSIFIVYITQRKDTIGKTPSVTEDNCKIEKEN